MSDHRRRPGARRATDGDRAQRPDNDRLRPDAGPRRGPGTAAGRSAASRRGRRRVDAPKSKWRRLLSWKTLGISALVAGVLGIATIGVVYARVEAPTANDFATSQTSIVYYADGKTELGQFSVENRIPVSLEQVPDHVQKAVLAAEDRSFYENTGVSVLGIARATWNNLRGGGRQGASTITQQYVKNYYLTQEQTYSRKIEEIFLAVKIDRQRDKNQILEDYLNTIYFGRGAYGIQTAAKAYFGKSVSDMTVEEGAALASIIRSPAYYDPAKPENVPRLEKRFHYTLDGMVQMGGLDQPTASAAKLPAFAPPQADSSLAGPKGYLMETVRQELMAKGIEESEINRAGLRIRTTFDAKAQQAAQKAVAEEFPTKSIEGVHAGLAAVRPGTGEIVALYGGADFLKRQWNDATQGRMQAGSTFKAFVLAAALEDGISLKSRYVGNSPWPIPGTDEKVRNSNQHDYGDRIDLLKATASSVNTAFAELTYEIGAKKVKDSIMRAGIPEDGKNGLEQDVGVRIGLGIAAVSPLQLSNAYATLAAEGQRSETYSVAEVRDRGGNVIYQAERHVESAYDPDVTAEVTYALEGVIKEGSGTEAKALGRPAAGKTGTTDMFDDSTTSSWFVGYTPQLSAAVGFYKEDAKGNPMDMDGVGGLKTFYGGEYPARIWTAFMKGALDGLDVEEFPEPADLGEVQNPKPTPTRTHTPTPEPTTATPVPTPTEKPKRTFTPPPKQTETPLPTTTETAKPPGKPTPTEPAG